MLPFWSLATLGALLGLNALAAPHLTAPELLPDPRPLQRAPLVPLTFGSLPNTPAPAAYRPANLLYPQQWNLALSHLPQAWSLSRGARVTVVVLDTGAVSGPALGRRLLPGYDFVADAKRSGDGDGRDADPSGVGALKYHGEVVANIIAASHLGSGMAGINPQAQVLAVRVAGEDGLIAPQDLIDGLRWAAGLSVGAVAANPYPARIINLSLYADFVPLTGCDRRIQAALDEVSAKGVLVVAGAANDAADARFYSPAGCRNVLTVSAVNRDGLRASYANYGPSVALSAYGGENSDPLWLSGVDGAQRRSGTSFAAPQVAGVASLMLGLNPRLSPAQLTTLIKASARPFAGGVCDAQQRTCGAGVLDAGAALRAAQATLAPAARP